MVTAQKILKILLKDFAVKHTVTSLAKEADLSRVGTWKILKKLETEKLLALTTIGSGKTSTYNISLNWNNILTEKKLEIILTEDAQNNQRWLTNFAELEKKVEFLIIYGSILHSPKEAKDIDILTVANKNKLNEINEIITKMQKIQIKKIHAHNFTETELKGELSKQNKVFIDAIKNGTVLFGQERFIKFVKEVSSK